MLIPSCGNGAASPFSKTQPEPNAWCVAQTVSRTLTTNQPSPAGRKPDCVSSSCASSVMPLLSSSVRTQGVDQQHEVGQHERAERRSHEAADGGERCAPPGPDRRAAARDEPDDDCHQREPERELPDEVGQRPPPQHVGPEEDDARGAGQHRHRRSSPAPRALLALTGHGVSMTARVICYYRTKIFSAEEELKHGEDHWN